MELTVVMPCLNEAETVETCVRKALGLHGGARRRRRGRHRRQRQHRRLAGDRPRRRAPASSMSTAKGYGSALMGGIRAARGTIRHHGRRRRHLRLHRAAAVRREAARRAPTWSWATASRAASSRAPCRRCTATSATRCCRSSGGCSSAAPIGDFHCGLRGFRARLDTRPRPADRRAWSSPARWSSRRRCTGCACARCPTTLSPDGRNRPPHLRSWRDGWRHLRFLLLYSPRWLFSDPRHAR